MSTEPLLGVGSKFGLYRIGAMLGRGGMGVVYRAEDERLRRSVALKLLASKLGDDPRYRARFLRESQLAAATEHPGIVPVYEAGEVDGLLFIAMRYVEGRDLAAILREGGALDPLRAVELIDQLADALDAAHARGLVHRDVKPSNALVAQERAGERVYLVDFGITHDTSAGERLTETGQMVGTPDYLAPERIRGGEVDGRADVYSLGCVLFECLTGEVPFPRTSEMAAIYAHLEDVAPSVSERRPGLSPALDDVVGRALAKDPGDRSQSCGELAAAARAAVAAPTGGASVRAPARARTRRPRGGRAAAWLAASALLAAAAIAAVLIIPRDENVGAPARLARGQVVALDSATGRIERRLPAGTTPTALTAAGGFLWMVDAEDRTLLRLDPKTGEVDARATGATPIDVAVGSGGLWVMNATPRESFSAVGPVASEIVRLDPASGRPRGSVTLARGDSNVVGSRDNQLATSADAVWSVGADGLVARIDGRSGAVTGSTPRYRAFAVAAGGAGVWALGSDDSMAELDARTGRVRRKLRLTGGSDAVAVGDTAAWVTSLTSGRLWRVGRERGGVPGSVVVGAGAAEVLATARSVWVTNPTAGTVTQVDPAAMRVVRVVEVGGAPRSLATDGRTVWVTVSGTGTATKSSIAGVTPVVASCEPVVGGNGGKADLLIASDLPLQGDARLSAAQMAQAITFVMRERHFRAGRHRVAFQSCDDALAGTGRYDEARCAANGRAYARNATVVAVIGTFNSGCALEVLPELNRAEGGPVPMISPLNSYVGLTREEKRDPLPGGIGSVYPTGRRNFVRVYPADDLQGVALARFAADRGRSRAFILYDRTTNYSPPLADAFEASARPAGLRIVGRTRWDSNRVSYIGLAQRIERSGADVVLVSGVLESNAGKLVRDLRATLGRRVDLVAPDGLGPPSAILKAAGPAARGMFLSESGRYLGHLPPRGADFVKRFARTQPGVDVEQYAVYAAQTAETLLDAIARSDGTRASVLKELFSTDVRGGLVGDVSFDERGDVRQAAETVLRLVGGDTGASLASTAGGVVERVLTVSPSDAE